MNAESVSTSDDTAAATKSIGWKQELIACSPLIGMFVLGFYVSTYENSCPSMELIEYGPFVWILVTLGVFQFMMRRYGSYSRKEAMWKRILASLFFLLFILFIARWAVLYGAPAVVNRFVGEAFEVRTRVLRKYWNRRGGPRLEVADYYTVGTGLYIDEPLYREVRKGDFVIIYGVQSVLGRTVIAVIKDEFTFAPGAPRSSQ